MKKFPEKDSETMKFLDSFLQDCAKEIDQNYTYKQGAERVSVLTFPHAPLIQHFFLDKLNYMMTIDWSIT